MSTTYLKNRTLFLPQIDEFPAENLGIIVVIPCFNETNLLDSLQSLKNADAPDCSVEVIVIINDGEHSTEEITLQNQNTYKTASIWASENQDSKLKFHILYHTKLPAKKSGVGLARKIGMDEAVWRFEKIGNPTGLIVCFDADSKCQPNYFQAIAAHFKSHPKIQAASIRYAHPLHGVDYPKEVYKGIVRYELHLRYFTFAKRLANYPHAFETIGSSMAVRADSYQALGGMNTRKAGEDFYFLNKFIVLGMLNELNDTCVIPSPRISDRVPFGTGKAIGDFIQSGQVMETYAIETFMDLKKLCKAVPDIYESQSFADIALPEAVVEFFQFVKAKERIDEILSNTTSENAFEKRFYRWFDPFMVMKFAHFCRDHYYPNISIERAGEWLQDQEVNDVRVKALIAQLKT